MTVAHDITTAAPEDEYAQLVRRLDAIEAGAAAHYTTSARLAALEGSEPTEQSPSWLMWSSSAYRTQLEENCSLAVWDVLQAQGPAGIEIAKRIVAERFRRSGQDGDAPEVSDEHWRAACIFARLLPDLPAFYPVSDQVRMPGSGLLKNLLSTLLRNAAEGIQDAPAAIRHLRRAAAGIWEVHPGMREYSGLPHQRAQFHQVNDYTEIARRLRLAIRVVAANDDPDAGPAPLSVRLNCPLNAFAQIAEQLHKFEGFSVAGATHSSDFQGTTVATQLFLSARCHWLLDGRPVRLELVTHLGQSTARNERSLRRSIDELATAANLAAPGGEITEVSPIGAVIIGLRPGEELPDFSSWAPVESETLLGAERCRHHNAQWVISALGLTRRLSCHDCLRDAVAVVPTHRLPEPEFRVQLDQDDFSEQTYLACERIRAELAGEGLESVPETIGALRRRDGLMSVDRADYAIGTFGIPSVRSETLDQALTGRRRGG